MKRTILVLIAALFIASLAHGEGVSISNKKTCKECMVENPCSYSVPAGDGCNTCSGTTYCVDGKWFTAGAFLCTVSACIRLYEIPNPFEEKEE